MAKGRGPAGPSKDWYKAFAGKSVGDFTLQKYVGSGKIGHVYSASHKDFPDSIRAVKLTFEVRSGWETELKKVLKLQLVDGLVHFHDLGTSLISHGEHTKPCQYTVWDYIAPGTSLRSYLAQKQQVPVSFLIAVVERILHVLHACDANGVARHGDLHSGNILVGDHSHARLDDALQPRTPVWVSDFGYGATGGGVSPKDDYVGLTQIFNEMIKFVDRPSSTATDKQILASMQRDLGKLLKEPEGSERRRPLELLRLLAEIKRVAQTGTSSNIAAAVPADSRGDETEETPTVGQFQVSEMIGDRWTWWQRLFVPTVPARSKILAVDIPTVVTGPRGCGKTMLFRRLSERLVVECGPVKGLGEQFAAFYVNANDFADAFAHFPASPTAADEARLICYANLCVLSDFLAVQSARVGNLKEPTPDALLALVQRWLVEKPAADLLVGEDRLERYRSLLDSIKWMFPGVQDTVAFPGYSHLCQIRWLPHFVQQVRSCCPWIGDRSVLIFIDDFSTPRVSRSMQKALNRLFLQRSSDFLAKVATEAWSTFVPEDSSGKNLQDGDDYQLVDMGEESLFLPDSERLAFLDNVFRPRLAADSRVPKTSTSLRELLGLSGHTKTDFARRLRLSLPDLPVDEKPAVGGGSQQRGRSRRRVHYSGEDVFMGLWSGDTRTMIQLITDVIDQGQRSPAAKDTVVVPIPADTQDRVFRNRGGEWLHSHTRNEPTDPQRMRAELAKLKSEQPAYSLKGEYGDHLKAVVEAFVAAATDLLLGPMYAIQGSMKAGAAPRQVPRMAFRIEIVDEFRIEGLAQEIYRDLVRYGLFMRDNRGKSVRGAFVPRLYLRRLLLPFCTLPLSKRDSVQLTCERFKELLLEPDRFKSAFKGRRTSPSSPPDQLPLFGDRKEMPSAEDVGNVYDDLTTADWTEDLDDDTADAD